MPFGFAVGRLLFAFAQDPNRSRDPLTTNRARMPHAFLDFLPPRAAPSDTSPNNGRDSQSPRGRSLGGVLAADGTGAVWTVPPEVWMVMFAVTEPGPLICTPGAPF